MVAPPPPVLFHTYDWAFQRPGGGEVQLLKTREHLEALGQPVELFDRWTTRLDRYPLVHSFSLQGHEFWGPARLSGCRLVVSTIHWPWIPRETVRSRIRGRVARTARKMLRMEPPARSYPFEQVDLLLPNSQQEAELLCKAYHLSAEQMHVVPNGVDERYLEAEPEEFAREYGLRDFVLCVGRIDGRKNQLAVIQALRDLDRPLVFLGEPVLGQEGYFEQCRAEAGPNVHFLGKIPHSSTLLASAYAAAGVLVLASYIETPGLCALEAGLAGTPLVVTERGCTKEYFQDLALYVDPDSPTSIRSAVESALRRDGESEKRRQQLRERIAGNFLWRHAAEATRAAYRRVLGEGSRNG